MMSQEANDLITRTGRKDPCGKLMRMYWQPAALVDELEGPRPVRPVKLLGENLVLFRDEEGRYGLIDRHCAHRGADLAFGRLWRMAGCAAPSMAGCSTSSGQCLETPAEPPDSQLVPGHQAALLSGGREERHPLGLSRRRRAAGVSGDRLLRRARQPYVCVQGPHQLQLAAGAGSRHRSGARLVPASLLRGRGHLDRLRQAVPRRFRRQRHADDARSCANTTTRSSMSSTPNTGCG